MAELEYVRELPGFTGSACLVRKGSDYFAVSSTDAMFTGPETLVFAADENGEVIDWMEVAGGRGMSRDEVIKDLEEK